MTKLFGMCSYRHESMTRNRVQLKRTGSGISTIVYLQTPVSYIFLWLLWLLDVEVHLQEVYAKEPIRRLQNSTPVKRG